MDIQRLSLYMHTGQFKKYPDLKVQYLEQFSYILNRMRTVPVSKLPMRDINYLLEVINKNTPYDPSEYFDPAELTTIQSDIVIKKACALKNSKHAVEKRRTIFDALAKRDSATCAYCHSVERLEIDHIRPVKKRGSNSMKNLQLLCRRCNMRKKDKWPYAPPDLLNIAINTAGHPLET